MDTGSMTVDSGLTLSGDSAATNSTEPSGQGQADPQGSQDQNGNAGNSQENPEGGKEQGTEPRRQFRGPSKNQTIFELRQAVRERDARLKSFEDRLTQFEQKFQPRQEQKPSRTFWEAPEEVLDERITGHLSEMEKRLLERFDQRETQNQQATQWKQELSEAAKLIKGNKELGEEGVDEIRELLVTHPTLIALEQSPKAQAEYALHLWKQSKGITNNTALKQKAAGVPGTSTAGNTSPKMWTESEMESEMNKLPKNPAVWTDAHKAKYDELEREFKRAIRDNRVRK